MSDPACRHPDDALVVKPDPWKGVFVCLRCGANLVKDDVRAVGCPACGRVNIERCSMFPGCPGAVPRGTTPPPFGTH